MERFIATVAIPSIATLLTFAANCGAEEFTQRSQHLLEDLRRDQLVPSAMDSRIPWVERAVIDVGGFGALYYLTVDDGTGENRGVREYDVVGYSRFALGPHQAYVQARAQYRDFNPGDSFDESGDSGDVFVDYAFYQWSGFLDTARQALVSARIGRQPVVWGSGLTLDADLDAGTLNIEYLRWWFRAVGGVTVPQTIDFDSSRPEFISDTRRLYLGTLGGYRIGEHSIYGYALAQSDSNDTASLGGLIRYGYDSQYFGMGASGPLSDRASYKTEGVFETGSALSATNTAGAQTSERIQAWAIEYEVSAALFDSHRSAVSLGITIASGDSDRMSGSNTVGGNQFNTTDHGYNALSGSRTGLVFAPTLTNLAIARCSATTFVFQKSDSSLHLTLDCLAFAQLKAGGIDEPTNSGSYLGVEGDVGIRWEVHEDLSIMATYGLFLPSHSFERDGPRHGALLSFVLSF